MAEFSKLIITGRGQVLLAKMIAGTGDIQFTKIATSDAVYDPDQLEKLDELTGIRQTSLVSRIERVNEVAIKIEAAFHNTELKEGYYMRTLGLYADDPDEGEILYAVTTETTGNCYMPPYNGVTVSGAQIELITTVGNAENVSLEVDAAAVATIGNIRELRDNLGAVEIRFEETTSAERENIRSQDTLGKIFGKVRKYFEDLKAVAFSGRYSDLSGTPEIGNVDNTSDMDKPVSTAQQQALATQYQQLTGYTDQKIADLIGGAPETLDTLKEVADAIEENESVVTALDAAIGRKADQTALDDHTGNNTIHVTADDKAELAALRGDVTEINSKLSHVGMIVHSTKLDTEAKVIAIYGGIKWTKIEGRFLLGQSTVYGINSIGGEAAHVLSVNEIPSHTHRPVGWVRGITTDGTYSHYTLGRLGTPGAVDNWGQYVESTGGNGAHNNMPPYKTVYIWERTA